jgi:hypothetical protein
MDSIVKDYFVYPNELVNHYLRVIVGGLKVMVLPGIAYVKTQTRQGF